jgi:FkbM family methyltransferase
MLKQMIGRTLGRVLKPYGYELYKTRDTSLGAKDAQDEMAAHLKQLFAALEIDTVLDVGANFGQYYEFLRGRVGFTGHIHSFEPIPELGAKLVARSGSDPKWHVNQCALGIKTGKAQFHISDKPGWSSLRELRRGQSRPTDELQITRSVEVEVRSLDDVVGSLKVGNLYLKLDTQGSDLDVLRGGEATLKIVKGLQTELGCIPCYDGAASPAEVLAFLEARGFWMTAVDALWQDDDFRIGEADAVFRRIKGDPTGR